MCSSTALHSLYSGNWCSRSTHSQMSALEMQVLMRTSERCKRHSSGSAQAEGTGTWWQRKKIDISSAESHSSWQMVDLMIRNNISVCRNIWNFISVFYCHRFWLIMKMRVKWMLNTAVSFMHHWDRKTHHVKHPHCGDSLLTNPLWKRKFLQSSI